MCCFHKKYTLGDKHDVLSSYFAGWDEVKDYLVKDVGATVILPLFLYDHSGITMSTAPFSCPWDSGQVGFIYVTEEDLKREYGENKPEEEFIKKILRAEVAVYDQYISGDVWYFVIKNDEGDVVESCGGFFGHDAVTEAAQESLNALQSRAEATQSGPGHTEVHAGSRICSW
jgi:hypothetical protein